MHQNIQCSVCDPAGRGNVNVIVRRPREIRGGNSRQKLFKQGRSRFGVICFALTRSWFGFLTAMEKLKGWEEVLSLLKNQNGTCGKPGFTQHWI